MVSFGYPKGARWMSQASTRRGTTAPSQHCYRFSASCPSRKSDPCLSRQSQSETWLTLPDGIVCNPAKATAGRLLGGGLAVCGQPPSSRASPKCAVHSTGMRDRSLRIKVERLGLIVWAGSIFMHPTSLQASAVS